MLDRDGESSATLPGPPVARRVPKVTTLHGEAREDAYDWLRERGDPEVLAYLEPENAYTEAVMAPTRPLQEALYKEMLGRSSRCCIQTTAIPAGVRGGVA